MMNPLTVYSEVSASWRSGLAEWIGEGPLVEYSISLISLVVLATAVWIAQIIKRPKVYECPQPPLRHWAQQLTSEEYAAQVSDYTKQQIQLLINSQQYRDTMATKGPDEAAWNWQKRERKGDLDREDEQEYLSNIENVSHPEVNSPGEALPPKGQNERDFLGALLRSFHMCAGEPPLEFVGFNAGPMHSSTHDASEGGHNS
jgi:hypothetical protein